MGGGVGVAVAIGLAGFAVLCPGAGHGLIGVLVAWGAVWADNDATTHSVSNKLVKMTVAIHL